LTVSPRSDTPDEPAPKPEEKAVGIEPLRDLYDLRHAVSGRAGVVRTTKAR